MIDLEKIKLIKLNKDYQSDPNIAKPEVQIDKKKLTLMFNLNYQIYNFKENQVGKIIFNNCHSYRIGNPNDEGFYMGDNKIWNNKNFPNLEWNCFYEVCDTPDSYLQNFKILYESKDNLKEKLNHYVFFMKEGTFECLAESYIENIENKNQTI